MTQSLALQHGNSRASRGAVAASLSEALRKQRDAAKNVAEAVGDALAHRGAAISAKPTDTIEKD